MRKKMPSINLNYDNSGPNTAAMATVLCAGLTSRRDDSISELFNCKGIDCGECMFSSANHSDSDNEALRKQLLLAAAALAGIISPEDMRQDDE